MTAVPPMSAGERALDRLMSEAHLATAGQLGEIVARAAAEFGARDVEVLLVDHGQTELVPLDGRRERHGLEGTLAGRVFRRVQPHTAAREGGERLWVPLLDGLERLGVLGLTFDSVDEPARVRSRQLAWLTAELVITKGQCGDALHRTARSRRMALAAEMQWSLMPPLTAGTGAVAVAAMLEPAYEVGGDLIDYALEAEHAHLAVFDSVGHGVQASMLAALAVGSYRNGRRAGESLEEMMRATDLAVEDQFAGELFVTAIFAVLDVRTGRLAWVNAGHPPPLLLRDQRVVKELTGRSGVPLGLGLNERPFTVHEEQLQPGDRVLLYTDGVIEARTPGGTLFGVERLIEFIVQAEGAGEPLPETMRRLSRALVDHQHGHLRDDATQMLVEWSTGAGPGLTRRFDGPPA